MLAPIFNSLGGLHQADSHRGRPCSSDRPGRSRADQGAVPGSDCLGEAREGALSPEQASEARSNHQWASSSPPEWLHRLQQQWQWKIHSRAICSCELRPG
jgi:hypothetical protein